MGKLQQLDIFDVLYPDFKFDKEITVLETFAGIGSQRKALDRLAKKYDLKVNYLPPVEFDKYAIASYNAIHSTNHKTKDITKTFGWEYQEQIDLLTWSFPCQDISLAGKGEGLKLGSKTRSSLGWEIIWLIGEMEMYSQKPKVLLMENVKNLLGEKHIKEFNELQKHLEKLGYKNYWQILNAKDYGIPQNRERVFMVSILGDYNYNFPKPIPLEIRLKDLLEKEVGEKYYLSDRLLKSLTDTTDRNGYLRSEKFKPIDLEEQEYGYSITTKAGSRPTDNFIKVKRHPLKFLNRNQKNIEGDYAFTIDTAHTGGIKEMHRNGIERIRKLTPLECWRLMGFDDEDFQKAKDSGVSDTQLYKQAGNSIVVDVLEHIFEMMIK